MHTVRGLLLGIVATSGLLLSPPSPRAQEKSDAPRTARELAGLWEAKRRFGPDVRGPLLVWNGGGMWRAEIAGRTAEAKPAGDGLAFELPGGRGKFQGRFEARRARIVGHWIQPGTITNGTPYASPVALVRDGPGRWRGSVEPLDDTMTMYLAFKIRDDGTVGAFLRNPERNVGRFVRVDQIEREGESVKLLAANVGGRKGRVLAEGRYDEGRETLTVNFPSRGGSFDFRRVGADEASDFYPRGRPSAPYVYAPPPALDDGWPTASLEDVGISRDGMQKFIRMIIDTPMDSVSSQEVHGVLVARRGKLVLEEYFHGEHRERPHDTRSAAKALTSTLLGAAISAGVPLSASSPVHRVMNGGAFPADLEPRKRALAVEHLLTMSSGLDCDDADQSSPGREDFMTDESGEPDYYKFTMALKMIREPGAKSVYCSVQPNLVGGVLQRASGRSLPALFQNLIAGPLAIKRYYLNLTPTGDAYMGGGARFLPRDFMKLGQLHLNGGTWNGRKVLTPEWSRRATSHLVNIGPRKYGYFWWVEDYPYRGRTVRAFMAAGNGGQIVIGVPELDLVVAFYGGNYNDPALFVPQRVYVPQHILPAVREGR